MVSFACFTILQSLKLTALHVMEEYGLAALGMRHEEGKAVADPIDVVRIDSLSVQVSLDHRLFLADPMEQVVL